MRSRIKRAIDYIKGYCEKHEACDQCRLQDKETKICILRDAIPVEWDYSKSNGGDNE